MKTLRYLNTVLTVIAVLLTLNLWTMWTASPVTVSADMASPAHADGLVNAGAQRQEMIALMKRQTQAIEDLTKMLKSGEARVRLENAPNK